MSKIKNGFTPIFDSIRDYRDDDGQFGHVTAHIFGIIWRVCEFKDRSGGVVVTRNECWASHETIAKAVGVSSKTVQRHARRLLKSRFIKKIRTHEKYRTPVYGIGERVQVDNMTAIILDTESTIENHGGQRVHDMVDIESTISRTESPPIETSSTETSRRIKKSLGKAAASPPGSSPSFDYDTIDDEISHLDVNGCFVLAKLKGETEHASYPVTRVTDKRIWLQTGITQDDIKPFDPEKVLAVYQNGSFKRVVLGIKEDKLDGDALIVFQDLQKLFGASLATASERSKYSKQFKEFALIAADKIGHFAIRLWVNWYGNDCKDQAGCISQKFSYCQRSLETAILWAKKHGIYDDMAKDYSGLTDEVVESLKTLHFTGE